MRLLLPFVFLLVSVLSSAQQAVDINQAIQLTAEYPSNSEVTFTWRAKENTDSYRIYYRTDINEPFQIDPAVLTPTDTTYTLTGINPQTRLAEIQVRQQGGSNATGYMQTGLKYLPSTQYRRLLIAVTESLVGDIALELALYGQALELELWDVDIVTIPDSLDHFAVKAIIQQEYDTAPINSLLLVGHIAVPYSGNNAIDGHTSGNNHRGAWAADAYYGDLDGTWTDSSVNNEEASRAANKNIPGDGKFDQNTIPSSMEIAVGRIDFSDLPAFADDEATLTNKYLAKNIAYRTGQHQGTRRGMVDNNFGLGEGFGQGAIKSFSSFFPVDSIDYGTYSTLKEKDYLWSFGAGGGSYKSASGIINTNQLAVDSVQSIFTTIFGSYFGDWDNSDNLLRASIGSGSTLINAWSGRPVWHFHSMAMGATVGDVLRTVQNDTDGYYSQFGRRLTHIALMGDPTLKMYYSPPVSDLELDVDDTSALLTWTAPAAPVDGYHVYEIRQDGIPYRLTFEPITTTSYMIECPEGGGVEYIVQPVMLEVSPSGSYYNTGAGASVSKNIILPAITASFDPPNLEGGTATFQNTSTGATSFFWDFGDGTFSEEENPMHTYSESGTYDVTLIASTECKQDTITATITVVLTSTTDMDDSFLASPNPTSGMVTLTGNVQGNYTLVNSLGAVVQSGQIQTTSHSLDLVDLPAGLYFLQLANGWQQKVVKR